MIFFPIFLSHPTPSSHVATKSSKSYPPEDLLLTAFLSEFSKVLLPSFISARSHLSNFKQERYLFGLFSHSFPIFWDYSNIRVCILANQYFFAACRSQTTAIVFFGCFKLSVCFPEHNIFHAFSPASMKHSITIF